MPEHPRARGQGAVYEHVVIAGNALGRALVLPEQVHHVDYDKKNNANTNLVICPDHAYHRLLHHRTDVLRAGGDPDTERLCSKCRQVKPKQFFAVTKRCSIDGKRPLCGECRHATRSDRIRIGTNYKRRVNADTVLTVRRMWDEGCSAQQIAVVVGLSKSQILNIGNRKHWAVVPEERSAVAHGKTVSTAHRKRKV